VVKMPGDCKVNDSWTLTDEYSSTQGEMHALLIRHWREQNESPWKLMSESLKVLEKSLNYIFNDKLEPCPMHCLLLLLESDQSLRTSLLWSQWDDWEFIWL